MQLKKLPYLLRYVPDQYETNQICEKAILENDGTLKSVPDCYKNREMCNKSINNYPHPLEYVLECFMTQKMRDKAVHTYPSTIKFVPECFILKKCVINQLIDVILYFILFLIDIKLKKCVAECF